MPRIANSHLIEAPWTDDQVASLNAYQKCGYHHPFTYYVPEALTNGQPRCSFTRTTDTIGDNGVEIVRCTLPQDHVVGDLADLPAKA